jgi:hypothetical protein
LIKEFLMSKHAQRSGRTSPRKIRRLALMSAIVAVFALGATAAVSLHGSAKEAKPQPNTAPPANQSNNTGAARANAGFRAGAPLPLDPQTAQAGQVRPLTQEEAQRLAGTIKQLVNQSTEGLQSVKQADGTVSLDLHGRFQSMTVAKRNDDGEVVQSCVDNPEAAAVFFEIDPQLVGVKKSASRSPKANSAAKGEVR